jgi:catechol 2,3-dioxygenase-like lactoylglutathione lyase family enzyme
MIKSRLMPAVAALALIASNLPASADSIPGLRGHDHTGITVPDVKAATAFFTDVIGCEHAMSFGPFSDDKGTFMQDVVNVNPRAVIDEISMVRCGYGSNIELFQYESPDQAKTLPKNSDIGGHHIALYVDDIDKAAAYLQSKGVKTLKGPIPINEGPAAGQ